MISNRQLILPYAAPYLAYVFIASAFGDILPTAINYFLRIAVVIALLLWAKKWYFTIAGPCSLRRSILTGIGAGVLGFFVWLALLLPFVDRNTGESWEVMEFGLRLFSAGLLVPIFEELLMRGFFFRLAWQWAETKRQGLDHPLARVLDDQSIDSVPPGAWSWPAVFISTLVFTVGHQFYEWPASIVYSLLMVFLWIRQKDLLVCIVAHATTNIILGLYVFSTKSWYLW
ncbi:MAG: CPBP family glutamic-type intramembrane protease [Desulfocapsaceae bacterium]|nr:CPBP family glutamic-type intramembrane protease [Desulfocapsaceae bacterium]